MAAKIKTTVEEKAKNVTKIIRAYTKNLTDQDKFRLLSMVSCGCRTELEEMEALPDPDRKVYDDQRLNPYH